MPLAPPHTSSVTPRSETGSKVFGKIGCDSLSRADASDRSSPGSCIDRVMLAPYSDFLCTTWAGSVTESKGTLSSERCAPLRSGGQRDPSLLHDGRAKTLEDAIRVTTARGAFPVLR